MLAGCVGRNTVNEELARVRELADGGHADSALTVLRGIDKEELDEYNRHYYDLMSIKAADKAYLTFTNDSLICDVISYFDDKGGDEARSVAYYYGGRVYRELGDAPRALGYFQQTLDALDDSQLQLKGKTASQMGQTLAAQYLFEQAKPRFQEAIHYNIISCDTVALMYNYRNLGEMYCRLHDDDSTIYYYQKSLHIAHELLPRGVDEMETRAMIIDFYNNKKDTMQVLQNFKELEPFILKYEVSDFVLVTGLNVYLGNKEYEKAENIAFRLLQSESIYSREHAYSVLSKLAMHNHQTMQLYDYVKKYKECMDTIDYRASRESLSYKDAYYNYSSHERVANEQKNKNQQLLIAILIISIACLALAVVLLCVVFYNKKLKYQLALQLSRIEQLKPELSSHKTLDPAEETVTDLRMLLVEKYKQIVSSFDPSEYRVSDTILNSEAYMKMKAAVINSALPDASDWKELDEVVNSSCENFSQKLYNLYSGISELEYHVCLLVKCGFTPTEIGFLTCRTKGSIANLRRRLYSKIFFNNGTPTDCDNLIMAL